MLDLSRLSKPIAWPPVWVLLCAVLLASPVWAEDADSRTKAFARLNLVLYDVPLPDGVPLPWIRWRFSQGQDETAALVNPKAIVQGTTNSKGEVLLNKQQRLRLAEAWKGAPNQLWFLYGGQCLKLVLQETGGRQEIVFERPEGTWERERRLLREQAERDQATPLDATAYTQVGFDAAPFEREYSDWQRRFRQDLDDMNQAIRSSGRYEKLMQAETPEEISGLFARSVQTSRKGMAFKRQMLADYAMRQPATEGTEVTPSAYVVSRLVLSPQARPVGFGGSFSDDGHQVELWYMVFDDLRDWNMQDFKNSLVFSAFSPARLPSYQSIERNVWPALVFVRDEKGQIMLYGFSKELAAILQNTYSRQLF